MAKPVRAWGGSGVKGRPVLKRDLEAMSDRTKRAKRAKRKKFEETTTDNLKRVQVGKKPRSVSERDLDQFRSVKQRIRRLQGKVADLRGKANAVDRSGTGNVKAAATYRKAANEYAKQVVELRKKLK